MDKLRLRWSKKEKDIVVHYPGGLHARRDARFLTQYVFRQEVLAELARRGYDIATIKFEINKTIDNG